jgi:hypothetical protein
MTIGMCWPHPHHVVFSVEILESEEQIDGNKGSRTGN